MTTTDEVLESNARYAESFDKGSLPLPRRAAWRLWRAWTHASIPTNCWVSTKGTRT